MKKRTVLVALAVIILVGFLLRIYKIGHESFWIDESATVYTTKQEASVVVKNIYTTTSQAPEYFPTGGTPPFYFITANYWTKLVGLSEVKLRLLSAIFGVISVYFMYLVGKMIFDYKTGLIAAFLLSINYLHIYYSQEARGYNLGILLTLLTVYFLLNALKKKKASYWIVYVMSGALLVYTHYYGFFVLAFEYLFLIIFWKEYRKSFKNALFSLLGIFLLYLPWLPALLRQIADRSYLGGYHLGGNLLYDLVKIFVQFNSWLTPDLETRIALRKLYHSIGNFTISSLFNVSIMGWLAILSVLALTGLFIFLSTSLLIKNKKLSFKIIKDKRYVFLLMWFLVPLLIPVALTIAFPGSPTFGFVHHVIFASAGYYLIVANSIAKSKKQNVTLILIVTISILPLYSNYANFEKQQWKEAAEYLQSNRLPDETLVVVQGNHILPLSYYYRQMGNVVCVDDIDTCVQTIDELKSKIKNEKEFWLVYTSERFGDTDGSIKRYLDANYGIASQIEFTGIKIFKYSKNEINDCVSSSL